MTTTTTAGRPRIWPWLVGGIGAALIAVQLVAPDSDLGIWAYLAGLTGAAAVAVVAAFRLDRPRRARSLLAAGIVASALGDVTWQLYVTTRGSAPDVSWADVPWMASYVFVGAALLALRPPSRNRLRDDRDSLIDVGLIIVIGSLVVWELWVGPTVRDSSTPLFVRLVWAAYPLLDAALLGLLLRVLVDRSTRGAVNRLVAAGIACWLVSDLGFLVLGDAASLNGVMNAGWMLGSALLAAACWRLRPTEEPPGAAAARTDRPAHIDLAQGTDRARDTDRPISATRVGLAVLVMLFPWVFELREAIFDVPVNPVPLVLATIALAALVWARTLHLLHLEQDSRARLASSERLFRRLSANSSDAVVVLDSDGVLRRESPGLASLLGVEELGTVGTDILSLADELDGFGAEAHEVFDKAVATHDRPFEAEFRIPRADGSAVWVFARVINLLRDPDVGGVVVNLHDVTDRKRMEDVLVHQAFHDALTGLANRALFRDRLEHSLQQAARTGQYPAVLYIDLDGFKHVNDSLGHDAGDALLCEVGARLGTMVRPGDTVARLGGDEFAMLLEQSDDALGDARRVATRVSEVLLAPVVVSDRPIVLSASVGVAGGDPRSTATSVLRDADTAMYRAKTGGRGRWVEYEPAMRDAAVRRLQIETDLHGALAAGQLRLEFQPVIRFDGGDLVGFEALLRWTHPTLGEIPPDVFVPIAEEIGVINDIGRWVLDTACSQAAAWEHGFGRDLSMAVNVSARQLDSPTLYDDVRSALATSGISPELLVLEITETALIGDAPAVVEVLQRLRRLGPRLAVDDFGTGYSSLSHLQRFPIDILKIDRSFIGDIGSDTVVPDIVRGLLDLARTLRLETVAEGVESPGQLETLQELHCDLGQGYLFARPLSVGDAEQLLRDGIATPTPTPQRRGSMDVSLHSPDSS